MDFTPHIRGIYGTDLLTMRPAIPDVLLVCRAVLLFMNIVSFGAALQVLSQVTRTDDQHE
eukprot:1160142-Pelagomonas_calceolata.AAC.35